MYMNMSQPQAPNTSHEGGDDIYLNDTWSLYFHDPNDTNWTMASYVKIADISSAKDFWILVRMIGDNFTRGMFFIMREAIFPCWDDPSNIDGGCISLKILKTEMMQFWKDLCSKMLCEGLLSNNNVSWDTINGISVSPKKHFCIVKIWTRDQSAQHPAQFNLPANYNGEVIYKSNRCNISLDHIKESVAKV